MGSKTLHAVLSFILVALLVALADPFMLLMPAPAQMFALLSASALVAVLAGFVILEGRGDERDAAHRMQAGRVAYLSGLAILTLALLFQGFAHDVDPWIVFALVGMVLAKLAARVWSERYE